FNDFFLRFGGRMYPILQEKFALVPEAIHKKRHQLDIMAFRELMENILKLSRICYAIIRRQLHSRQQYHGAVPLAGFNDRFKVVANGVDGCASRAVIGAKLNNDDIRAVVRESLLDAVASSQRGFATDAFV